MFKVCHITSVHKQDDTRIFHKQCQSLAQVGYDVHLVAYGDSSIQKEVTIHGLGERESTRIRRILFGGRKAINKALSLECDLYHLHDPELLPFVPRLKRTGKRVVFDSHEDVPQQILEKEWLPLRKLVSRVYSLVEKFYLRRVDAVISVSPHRVDYLKAINPYTIMVTNYPILKDFEVHFQSSNPRSSLCFVGRVSETWNHRPIIEALQGVENVTYILCGTADNPEYIEQLKQADQCGVLDFRGEVAHEQVHWLYGQSLAGICWIQPSPNAGGNLGSLGVNKLFEQMSAGTPVICTDFILWKEIIDRYGCGIAVPSGDVEAFTRAVCYLRDNPEAAKVMGMAGRRAVEREFNWQTQEKIIFTLYQKLLLIS